MAKQDVTVWLYYSGDWNDVTDRVRVRNLITINHGAGNEETGVVPSDASLTFDNRDGEMNPENRKSSLFGLIGHNTPIEIEVAESTRFSGQVVSWKPRRVAGTLDSTRGDAWVDVKAQGTIRRLGQGEPPVLSAMTRALTVQPPSVAWWPLETSLLASTANTNPGLIADSPVGPAVLDPLVKITDGVLGSTALIDLSNGTRIDFPVPSHTLTPATGYVIEAMIRWQPDGFTGGLSVDAVRLIFETSGAGTETDRVNIETNSSSQAFLFMLDTASGTGSSVATGNVYDGAVRHFRVSVLQNGTAVDGSMLINGESAASTSLPSTTLTKLKTVSINFVGESGTKLPAVGQVLVYNDGAPGSPGSTAYNGYLGETTANRFQFTCVEEGITATIVGDSSETQSMGPQYPDTTLNIFDEAARTDTGIVHDTRDALGLTMRTGRSLNNQDPAVVLDFEGGQIVDPLEPDIDDLGRINFVIASRRKGGQATATDEDGGLGTTAIGTYRSQVDINPISDAVLPYHASYHLTLGTDPDPRYPQVMVDLSDQDTDFINDVAAVDIGDLLRLENLPQDLGQAQADLLVLGYTEVVGTHTRRITFNTRPGGILSHIGQLDGDGEACLQTSGAQLGTAITAEQSSFSVYTSTGPLFTTSPPTGARIIVTDREVVPVTGIASALTDTFTRTVSNDWGTADSGQTWSLDTNPAGDFAVSGGVGQQTHTATNALHHCHIDIGSADGEVLASVTIPVLPTGASITARVAGRFTDVSNYYDAMMTFNTSGAVVLGLGRRVAGAGATVTAGVTLGSTHSAGNTWLVRYGFFGTSLRARAWKSTEAEPSTWTVTGTDANLTTGSRIALQSRRETGNTNGTQTITWDNASVVNPQTFTVSRDADQRMAHAYGASVKVYQPLRLTL